MGIEENNIIKFCSFYVSDWHLVTMLLPYINRKINEESKIATVLEEDIEENIEKLVEKLNLKNKEKILNLNWLKIDERKNIFTDIKDNKEIIIIINGSQGFIEKKNEKLKKYLSTHKINGKIKIINCYEIINYDGNISKILDEHDKILNTSGEKEIEEVFPEYSKENKIRKAI